MNWQCKYLISLFIIAACCLQQCCWGQSSTVRPYKFGFTIDQQQHRSEKRDERGIVMGEFGFITADGIYHVTVYATDEQGRFRILAMRNYPYESPPKTVEVMVKPMIAPPTTTTTTTAKPLKRHNFNTEACSGCFLRNGDDKPKSINDLEPKTVKNDIRPLSKSVPNPSSNKIPSTATKPVPASTGSSTKTNTGNPPPIMDIIMQKVLPALEGQKQNVATTTTTTTIKNKSNAVPPGTIPKLGGSTGASSANGDGDLYRFKYILDYNGHTETGKRNGDKQGSYYAIGQDNVERTIEYVANEFGYQPRIRWRKLSDNEIKSKENTLKDYEFVWFTQ